MSPSAPSRDRRRWTIGVAFTDDCRWAFAAALAAYGSSSEARADVVAWSRAKIPPATRRLFGDLVAARPRRPASLAPVLSCELADVAAECVHSLAAREPGALDRSLLLAVWDPGLWREETSDERVRLGLCDGARLAELTGLNVLDDLPARDLAQGGRGGPLFPTPDWLLARDPDHVRAVIHPGFATEITLLPTSRAESSPDHAQSVSLGLGPRLIGGLARRLSRRPSENDRAGPTEPRWIPELLAAWLADPEIAPALAGGWRPPMPAPAATIEALAQAARKLDVAAADAARTFVRLVARGIVGLLAALNPRPAETLLAIGGRLGRWLAADLDELLTDSGLPDMRPLGTADMEFAPQSFDAAATAWWGQLYLDQTPGNLPSLTGARSPRVLGRLTPGSPQQFLRLTRQMAASQPVVSLRTAI